MDTYTFKLNGDITFDLLIFFIQDLGIICYKTTIM